MTEAARIGLVERIMDALADLPETPSLADLGEGTAGTGGQLTAAERRARLALRIALMKRGEFVASSPEPEALSPADELPKPVPEPAAEPEPPPFIPAPPPKPARLSMSTLRIEDAASLLSAFGSATDADASTGQAAPKVVEEPAAPEEDQAEAIAQPVDVADLAATFAAMAPTASEPETSPPEVESTDTEDMPPEPAPKARRKRGTMPDLASAAAALADLQALGDDAPEDAAPDRTQEK